MLNLSVGERVRRGVIAGLVGAAAFSAWATIGRVLLGAEDYERQNGPWLPAVVVYFLALPFGGAVVGLCFPIARRWWGAMLLGTQVCFLVMIGMEFIGAGGDLPWSWKIGISTFVSLLLGGGLGLQRWSVHRKRGTFDRHPVA